MEPGLNDQKSAGVVDGEQQVSPAFYISMTALFATKNTKNTP